MHSRHWAIDPMGNFMSCVLICGAMEVVQVVNTNGGVEKLIRPIHAAELIWAHDRYKAAVSAAGSAASDHPLPAEQRVAVRDKFVLLPLSTGSDKVFGDDDPNAAWNLHHCNSQEIQQPQQSLPPKQQQQQEGSSASSSSSSTNSSCSSSNVQKHNTGTGSSVPFKVKKEGGVTTLVVSKRYLEQLLTSSSASTDKDASPAPETVSCSKQSRKSSRSSSSSSSGSRVSIWRPALESISESHNAGSSSNSSSSSRRNHQRQLQF